MKINPLLFILLIIPLAGFSQQSKLQQFYYQHAAMKGAKHISIECDLNAKEEHASDNLLRNMLYAKLLVLDTDQVDNQSIKKLLGDSREEAFESVVEARSKEDELHLMVKELQDEKLSFLAVVRDEANFIFVNIAGKFKIKELMDLGLDNVKNTDELILKLKKMDQCTETD